VIRRGRILAVHGHDGAPPYVVEWTDSDHPSVFIPGADACVVTADESADNDRAERQR
jgi:Domain of unknown function (DUF1918)